MEKVTREIQNNKRRRNPFVLRGLEIEMELEMRRGLR